MSKNIYKQNSTITSAGVQKIFTKFVSATFLIVVFLINGYGQQAGGGMTGRYTPSSLAPGSPAGALSSDFESVNPYSGTLNFALPLYEYGGRGEVGYTKKLIIEKDWYIRFVRYYSQPGNHSTGQPGQWTLTDSLWNQPLVNGPGVMAGRKSREGDPEESASQCFTQSVLTWKDQDYTEYELRDEQTNGQPAQYGSFNRGTAFRSHDGSNLRFVADASVTDVGCADNDFAIVNGIVRFTPSGYLYFPNGIKYRIENGYVSWMQDRNGNRLEMDGKDVIGRTPNTTGFGGVSKSVTSGSASLADRLRPGYSLKTTEELFPNAPYANGGPSLYNFNPNPQVVSEVTLPNGKKYEFYYNSYAELARVVLPTGAAIEYDFGPPCETSDFYCPQSGLFSNSSEPYIKRVVRERRLYSANGVLENRTTYRPPNIGTGYTGQIVTSTVEIFDGANHQLSKTVYSYQGNSSAWYPNFIAGRAFKTEVYDGNNNLLLQTDDVWQQAFLGACPTNPHLQEKTTTLADTNQVSKQVFAYDNFNNLTDTYQYDFGAGSFGSLKRRTHTDFVTDTNYTGNYLRSLPAQSWVSSDINGTTKASLTQFEYDNYAGGYNAALVSRVNVIGHDTTNYGTDKTIRGNVTGVTSYGNAQTQSEPISVYSNYDILGNVVKTYDAKGNSTTIDYTDRFGSPDNEARSNTAPSYVNAQNATIYPLNGQSTFAFPTSSTNALDWTTGYTQFDYFTGQSVNTEDINSVISKTFYNDALDRPTQSVTAIGTAFERQSNIIYDDANHRVETKSDLNALNDNLLKSESFYDGLGRTVESRRYEAGGGYITTKTVPFVMVQDTVTSIWRTATQVSNPYRANDPVVWTTNLSDSLGRGIKIITPDGAIVKTDYSGNAVTVTDQALKQHRSITNALGQLTRVDEPTDAGLGAINTPNQPTIYGYDTLGNLTSVSQNGSNTAQCGAGNASCSQSRTFAYDSLSRLKSAVNPESGTITYSYDANGNLQTKRDARGIKTVYDYDALNRLYARCYRNIGTTAPLGMTTCQGNTETLEINTPDVAYTYDNLTNAKGELIKVESSVSKTEYQAFDVLGRVTQSQQTTGSAAYGAPMTYKYNLSGALVEETYPSTRVVKNVLDSSGDLSIVQSSKNNASGYFNYAKSFTYTAAGAVSSIQLGNGKWESTVFNSRLQPTQIALGTTNSGTDKLLLNFGYGGSTNNGNVQWQKITVPTETRNNTTYPAFIATQTYAYDSLNRLKSAQETIPNQTGWKQTFKYDRYGNRNFDMTNPGDTTTPDPNCASAVCNPAVDPNTNKLVGYTFDNAGNTKIDANGKTFTYDAENKQTKVVNGSLNVGDYFYDGDGKRVKKIEYDQYGVEKETTIFIYDASGRMVAEYSTNVASATDAKVSYLTNDHLGSPRITTDAGGAVTSRRDFMPFGEEVTRASYGLDTVRQKFTSYERDDETQLDYAQARMHNYNLGRFQSPDPLLSSGRIRNPQTWNRYAYVLNNPLKFIDPTGLSEQGGTTIKHPDRRMVEINADEIITVSITADSSPKPDPVTGITGQRTYGENKFFVFEINTRLTGEDGRGLDQSDYTTQTSSYNDDGTINSTTTIDNSNATRTVTEDGKVVITGEKRTVTEISTAVNENPEVIVRQDASQEIPDSKNRVKINVRGVEKPIDYTVRTEGNGVRVIQNDDNKIIIPGIPKIIGVPVNNKQDSIVESMRPKRNGLVLRGY